MIQVPDHIQANFQQAIDEGRFDWMVACNRFLIGNSAVYLLNNFVGRSIFIESRGQLDGTIKYVVFMQGWVLGKDGVYHYETNPSSRSDKFIKTTIFDTKE